MDLKKSEKKIITIPPPATHAGGLNKQSNEKRHKTQSRYPCLFGGEGCAIPDDKR